LALLLGPVTVAAFVLGGWLVRKGWRGPDHEAGT
jgi:hypothetical protein